MNWSQPGVDDPDSKTKTKMGQDQVEHAGDDGIGEYNNVKTRMQVLDKTQIFAVIWWSLNDWNGRPE